MLNVKEIIVERYKKSRRYMSFCKFPGGQFNEDELLVKAKELIAKMAKFYNVSGVENFGNWVTQDKECAEYYFFDKPKNFENGFRVVFVF